ncbi:phage tail tape measure protein, TP901 family, core region [Lacticaseibacillus paracasei]|uniref:phage tail tape measure protein n=1 Tax=Lacticaseibacillus paracasei TaxID=1597 RepID=UPI000FEFDC47|nr:phage tail tape measure protein [Lacticaseibacillus paracasei]RNE08844.1 phage tail tape measure protein, TP901 family, core region [Lacticaseibacillus paracasei]
MAEPLGQMMIELGLDDTKFGNGLKNAKSQLKYFGSEMKAQASFYDAFGSKVDGLSAKEQGLTKMIAAQSKVVAESKKAYDGSLTSKGEMTKSSARLAANFEAEQAKLASLAKEYINTAKAEAEMSVKTTGVTGAINKLGTAQIAIGNRMKSLGDSMTTGITVPIATAFVAATAKAIKFQNQLLVIKNLLTTGGESAKEAISGVNKMQSDAIQYSNHYGVSVEKISAGYEELVRRGYTSKQAIAAMKTELQGALASGDDFNDVVSVASSTLESFGMKSSNTAKMTRNTKTAVNELAYAADLTATNFQDLGVGMSYVGATAHQAHFTLSETASALGVLSNNGVEADKAGTGLRKVIVSLNTAVKNIGTKNDVLASLGIKKEEIVGSNGQLKSLSTVMDVLNQHTKDMSATKKAAVFNSLFGTTGQQAGIILAQNSKQLAELNSQVDKAEKKNYVGSLSEKNLKSAQNQLKVLQQNVENLGMTLAQKVLPSVQPIIKDLTDAVNWFGKLNPQVQQNIVKWGLLAAAMGPVLSLVGRFNVVSGQLKTGLVGIISKFAGFSKGVKATQELSLMFQLAGKRSITFADVLKSTGGTATDAAKRFALISAGAAKAGGEASKSAPMFGGLAGKFVTAAGEAGSLHLALTPLGIGIAAVAGAAAIGVVAWEGFGKQMVESSDRASRWGSDIGKTADTAATEMSQYQSKVDVAMSGASGSVSSNAKTINSAFSGMITSAQKASKAQKKAADDVAKAIGGEAAAALEEEAGKEETARNKEIAKMKSYAKEAHDILKNSADNNVALNAEQRVKIGNIQDEMAEAQIKTLGLTAKQQRQVLAAELGETSKMSVKQLSSMAKSIGDASYQEMSSYEQRLKAINGNAQLSETEKNVAIEALEQEHIATMDKLGGDYIRVAKAQGKSHSEIISELTQQYGFTATQAAEAWDTYNSRTKAAADQTKKAVSVSLDGLSGSVKKAAESWNNLKLTDKNGKVKTNAVEEVQKAVKSGKTWNAIQLLLREGKMTTNAQDMVAKALAANKQWDDLKWIENDLHLSSNAKEQVASAMIANNQWNVSDWKEAQIWAINKTNSATIEALANVGKWDSLTPKQQQLIAQAKTGAALQQTLKDLGVWNDVSSKVRRAILKAIDESTQPAAQAKRAVDSFVEQTKTSVLKTIYVEEHVTQGRAGGGSANIATRAKGDSNFAGGLAMVNDQKGPTFREAIFHPNGGIEIPFGRNVIKPIEKHAQIVPAGMTARMFPKLPQYANGKDIPANATALSLANQVTQSLVGQQPVSVSNSLDTKNLEKLLMSIQSMMSALMQRDTTIDMDGRAVAQVQYPYLSKITSVQNMLSNRRKGYTN